MSDTDTDTDTTEDDCESLTTYDMCSINEIRECSQHALGLFYSTCANLCNNTDLDHKEIGKLVLKTFEKAAKKLIKKETMEESDSDESDSDESDTFDEEVEEVVKYITENIVDFVQKKLEYVCNELKETNIYDENHIGPEIYCINSKHDSWDNKLILSWYSIHNQRYSSGNVRFRLDRPSLGKESNHLIDKAIFVYYREYDKMATNPDEYKPVNVKDEIENLKNL